MRYNGNRIYGLHVLAVLKGCNSGIYNFNMEYEKEQVMHTSQISIGTEGYYSYEGIGNLNKTEAQLHGSYE